MIVIKLTTEFYFKSEEEYNLYCKKYASKVTDYLGKLAEARKTGRPVIEDTFKTMFTEFMRSHIEVTEHPRH